MSAYQYSPFENNAGSQDSSQSSGKGKGKGKSSKYSSQGASRFQQNGVKKILLAVMGVTGVGKSSFINVANGKARTDENSLEPSTTTFHARERFLRKGFEVILIDGPGFDNPTKADISILDEFTVFLKEMATQNAYLSGILYLHRITDVRVTTSVKKNLQLLQALCGSQFLPRLTLVTTMWDSVMESVGETRENQLKKDFWAGMLKDGAMCKRYYGNAEWANYILDGYLTMNPAQVTAKSNIEQEVLDSAQPLGFTAVGQKALEMLSQKFDQAKRRLQEKERSMQEMRVDGNNLEAGLIGKDIDRDNRELLALESLLARYVTNARPLALPDFGSLNINDTTEPTLTQVGQWSSSRGVSDPHLVGHFQSLVDFDQQSESHMIFGGPSHQPHNHDPFQHEALDLDLHGYPSGSFGTFSPVYTGSIDEAEVENIDTDEQQYYHSSSQSGTTSNTYTTGTSRQGRLDI